MAKKPVSILKITLGAIFGFVLIFIIIPIGVLFSLNYYNLNTSLWRDYKNDEFSFSFKYPQGSWNKSELPGNNDLLIRLESYDMIDTSKYTTNILALKTDQSIEEFANDFFSRNNYPNLKVTSFRTESGIEGKIYSYSISNIPQKDYYLKNQNNLFRISSGYANKYQEKITSTIKFE